MVDDRRDRIFTPLGMHNSELGLGPNVAIDDCVWIGTRPDGASDGPPDLPNTQYWRDMGTLHDNFSSRKRGVAVVTDGKHGCCGTGHPWGGMHSSALDVARLLQVTGHRTPLLAWKQGSCVSAFT